MRTWTSANGKIAVEAEFVSKTRDKVKPEKANRSIVTVDAERLS